MAINNPYQIYQQNAVQTASPERLLLMLYDGAIRFMNQAKAYLEKGELQQVHNNLIKAQDIIRELMVTLNMDYEISHQLLPLYDYYLRRLIEANLKKQAEPIDEVLAFMTDLRQTWEQAIRLVKSGQAANG
jgi:flagellar protein FliS